MEGAVAAAAPTTRSTKRSRALIYTGDLGRSIQYNRRHHPGNFILLYFISITSTQDILPATLRVVVNHTARPCFGACRHVKRQRELSTKFCHQRPRFFVGCGTPSRCVQHTVFCQDASSLSFASCLSLPSRLPPSLLQCFSSPSLVLNSLSL